MENFDTFLSYQFTGIDPAMRKERVSQVLSILEKEGKKVFCSDILERDFDLRGLNLEERYKECLKIQERQNFKEIVFFVMDKIESNGMKLELEKAIEKKQNGVLIILDNVESEGELAWLKPFRLFCKDNIRILKFSEI